MKVESLEQRGNLRPLLTLNPSNFSSQILSVTILKLLARTTGTGVVATGKLVGYHGTLTTCLLTARVASSGCCLCRICKVATTLLILRTLLRYLTGCLLYTLLRSLIGSLRLHDRQLPTHQDTHRLVVDGIYHRIEEFHALQLEDEKRVLLLIAGVAHRVLQVIEQAQIVALYRQQDADCM